MKYKIKDSLFLSLYYQMKRIRMVEERIILEYPKEEIRCPVHLCIGQEAIPAGVCASLKKGDKVLSNHRSHGHYLAKGGDLSKMIAEIYGKVSGCSGGRGGSQHLIDLKADFIGSMPIVGGTIPVATGIAWADLICRKKKVTVAFMGDAAMEGGVFHESLNFASAKKLPVLYICENNFYSIFTPLSVRQPPRQLYNFAKAQSVFSLREDGNDAMKVYLASGKAVEHIRKGRGPAFIQFDTYRLKEHCGPFDDPPGFRPAGELELWKKRDPIVRMERYLRKKKLSDAGFFGEVQQKIKREIDLAFAFAKNSPFPEAMPDEEQVYK